MAADRQLRAAVPARVLDVVRARAPGAELVMLERGMEFAEIGFLVPDLGRSFVLDVLPELTALEVVQLMTAGTDRIDEIMPARATLCSARGARDGPVVEWILGALLGAATMLLRQPEIEHWDRRQPRGDLAGSTVLVIGMGSIGGLLRSRLAMLGAIVVGVASHARDGAHAIEELPRLLPAADAVVLLTPLTRETRGLIGAAELAAMRDGTLLVNAARGAVLDTDALVPEVVSGRLSAILDVTEPEPLPNEHPLWNAAGVLSMTPHMAGNTRVAQTRAAQFAGDQLARWSAGEELLNIVRKGNA